MNIETVNGTYAQGKVFLGIFFNLTRRCGKNSHVNFTKFVYVFYNLIVFQAFRLVFSAVTAHNARNFKVGGSFKCLQNVVSYVAISHYCCSYFTHILFCWF